MKKWTSDDYAYAMDSDVISHGYETDLEIEEHQNYDISGVSLSYTEKKIPVRIAAMLYFHVIFLVRIFL